MSCLKNSVLMRWGVIWQEHWLEPKVYCCWDFALQGSVYARLIFQTTNEKFIQEKQSGKGVTERENMLKDLAKAYDAYMELLANLQEGTKVGKAREGWACAKKRGKRARTRVKRGNDARTRKSASFCDHCAISYSVQRGHRYRDKTPILSSHLVLPPKGHIFCSWDILRQSFLNLLVYLSYWRLKWRMLDAWGAISVRHIEIDVLWNIVLFPR